MTGGLAVVALVLVPLLGACDRLPGSAPDGCTKDTDCKGDRVCQSGQCVAPAGSTAASSATVTAANDGTDAKTPVLAPDDASFTDTRHGWGWSDRAWKELHDKKWGWAVAACGKGLDLPDLDAKAKGALVYNKGLAFEGAGDRSTARSLFDQSLALRQPNDPGRAEVAAALARVGGTAPPATAPPVAGCSSPSDCKPSEACAVMRTGFGTATVSRCVPRQPDQCKRGGCGPGLSCCHASGRHMCEVAGVGFCAGDPLVCVPKDNCAD